ncbi:MAG TPA: GntR family transcriptional regulator [Acidimicrobiales bacterium]|nr:GntR family transcriptional regulator [Acidimicrobiales bacterium]
MAVSNSGELALPRLRQESLASRAYGELKQAILRGELQPGAALAEVELAAALGISRTPVREALALLRRDGLVEAVPGGGNVVRMLRAEEVRELFLLREALEALAVREFVGGAKKDTDVLDGLLHRQRTAHTRRDVDAFLAADEEFHVTVSRLAGLPQVAELLVSLRERMRQAGLKAVTRPDRMAQVVAEHEAIVRAVRSGRADRAEKAVIAHLRATRAALDAG